MITLVRPTLLSRPIWAGICWHTYITRPTSSSHQPNIQPRRTISLSHLSPAGCGCWPDAWPDAGTGGLLRNTHSENTPHPAPRRRLKSQGPAQRELQRFITGANEDGQAKGGSGPGIHRPEPLSLPAPRHGLPAPRPQQAQF